MIHLVDWNEPENPAWFTQLELEQEVEAVYEAYSAELLSHASGMMRREDGAVDAVQEVFLRYFVERSYGRVIDDPRGWLYRAVRNYVFDRMDRGAWQGEVATVDCDQVADPRESAETRVENAQMAVELCSQFSAREMDCLRLRAGGASYEEIAGSLGIRCGTVSALLTRAHKKLRGTATGKVRVPSETVGALRFLFAGG